MEVEAKICHHLPLLHSGLVIPEHFLLTGRYDYAPGWPFIPSSLSLSRTSAKEGCWWTASWEPNDWEAPNFCFFVAGKEGRSVSVLKVASEVRSMKVRDASKVASSDDAVAKIRATHRSRTNDCVSGLSTSMSSVLWENVVDDDEVVLRRIYYLLTFIVWRI